MRTDISSTRSLGGRQEECVPIGPSQLWQVRVELAGLKTHHFSYMPEMIAYLPLSLVRGFRRERRPPRLECQQGRGVLDAGAGDPVEPYRPVDAAGRHDLAGRVIDDRF